MSFAIISIVAILVLGIVAAITSIGGEEEPIMKGHDCSTCSSMNDGACKIACLMEEKSKKQEQDA